MDKFSKPAAVATPEELVVELVRWIKSENLSARRKLETNVASLAVDGQIRSDYLRGFLEGENFSLRSLIHKLKETEELYAEFVCAMCEQYNDDPFEDDPGMHVQCAIEDARDRKADRQLSVAKEGAF